MSEAKQVDGIAEALGGFEKRLGMGHERKLFWREFLRRRRFFPGTFLYFEISRNLNALLGLVRGIVHSKCGGNKMIEIVIYALAVGTLAYLAVLETKQLEEAKEYIRIRK